MSSGEVPLVRGLFQRRITGDEALIGLARLRFRQAGMAPELYAEDPRELERLLRLAPAPSPGVLPTVHLDRKIDILTGQGRGVVAEFQRRFAGRVAGLIVHDRPAMNERLDATAAALRELGEDRVDVDRRRPPTVYLESANGLDVERFVRVAELIKDVALASVCVDIGHVGIGQARLEITRRLGSAGAPALYDPDLATMIEPVAEAMAAAVDVVITMVDALGDIDKSVHFHLHDGHPLTSGLADHLGFWTRVPIPFPFEGRYSLPQLYGLRGLAKVLTHAQRMTAPPSYTMEIHQVEGRLPLQDAQPLFAHWTDLTNAERMNYWLSVLTAHHVLITDLLGGALIFDPEPAAQQSDHVRS